MAREEDLDAEDVVEDEDDASGKSFYQRKLLFYLKTQTNTFFKETYYLEI